MTTRRRLAALVLATACLAALAAEGKPEGASVKIPFAAKDVPAALKAGDRVNLKVVLGSTITAKGKALVRSKVFVADLEVVSVQRQAKPADPTKAVEVEVRTTKEKAAKVEKLKVATVTVVQKDVNGKTETKKKPVPLILELVNPAKGN